MIAVMGNILAIPDPSFILITFLRCKTASQFRHRRTGGDEAKENSVSSKLTTFLVLAA